jgi:hypothetical protein
MTALSETEWVNGRKVSGRKAPQIGPPNHGRIATLRRKQHRGTQKPLEQAL